MTRDEAAEMLSDGAFEPNQWGRRAYDRFLSGPAQRLGAPDLVLVQRMAEARFSIFRCAGRHQAAGVYCRTCSTETAGFGFMHR